MDPYFQTMILDEHLSSHDFFETKISGASPSAPTVVEGCGSEGIFKILSTFCLNTVLTVLTIKQPHRLEIENKKKSEDVNVMGKRLILRSIWRIFLAQLS